MMSLSLALKMNPTTPTVGPLGPGPPSGTSGPRERPDVQLALRLEPRERSEVQLALRLDLRLQIFSMALSSTALSLSSFGTFN